MSQPPGAEEATARHRYQLTRRAETSLQLTALDRRIEHWRGVSKAQRELSRRPPKKERDYAQTTLARLLEQRREALATREAHRRRTRDAQRERQRLDPAFAHTARAWRAWPPRGSPEWADWLSREPSLS